MNQSTSSSNAHFEILEKIDIQTLNDNDVISFGTSDSQSETFKLAKFLTSVKDAFQSRDMSNQFAHQLSCRKINIQAGEVIGDRWQVNHELWFTKGINCEILQSNLKGWKKGKVKISVSLEFYPDEPDTTDATQINNLENKSLLDDIRKTFENDSNNEI